MEITLEKIELVKDRTGVTYKEAKEALERADGNVVDAIIDIEEITDKQAAGADLGAKGEQIADRIKEVVNKGNVSRIIVSRGDEKIMNLPLNAGILGALVAPWGVVMGVIAAFGFKCKVEVVKDDGAVIDITDKAGNLYDTAVSKGEDIYNGVKEKSTEKLDSVKDMTDAAVDKAQSFADAAKDAAKDAVGKFRKSDDAAEEPEKDSEDDMDVVSEDEDGDITIEDSIDLDESDLDIENADKDEE
ncbi:MAG: DUF4342 domain-containing protein [Eubacteriales bacterium]|nr:DUF4342 domain-containing protein [Eubacteriales bacterium]